MNYRLCILFTLLLKLNSFAQSYYTGFIGEKPIEFTLTINHDDDARAVYVYPDIDEPIKVIGRLQYGNLTLLERDSMMNTKAVLSFDQFQQTDTIVKGSWIDSSTKKQLAITLRKNFGFNQGDSIEWANREIIQSTSLQNYYFKLVLSKSKNEFLAEVIGLKIIEKKTDRLIQKFDVDCQFMGLDNISTGDYNFDGKTDFSIFESSYAGPNTTRIYFLYNATTQLYFESGFAGVSLEFDPVRKIITEHNQCCAGRQYTISTYTLIDNKMVLVEKHCFI